MTLLSKCILAGYIILHIFFIVHLDRHLKVNFRNYSGYRRKARWFWILPYAAAAAIPVAAVFLPEGAVSFFLQRIGNVFLAFDLHIIGLFFLTSFVLWLIFSAGAAFRRLPPLSYRSGREDSCQNSCHKTIPLYLLLLILAAGLTIPAYGLYHAQDTVVHFFQADLRKTGGSSAALQESGTSGTQLRIALIADLHLGVNSHLQTTEKMVRLINEQQPDVVLVAGDIFTSSYAALREPEKYAEALREILSPMGVYAVYGNHDVEETLFSGFAVHPVSQAFRTDQIEQFFDTCHFTVLCDGITEIAGGTIELAGRIDGNKAGDGTKNRLTPAELLKNTDASKPVLVLEHEPVEYEELGAAGADMILSGHTHNGQIFPGNLYVNLVNENGYGHKTLYGMETFVTSGVGTFGPPMRTGTSSEIMIIDVQL